MSFQEELSCRFEIGVDGYGRPNRISFSDGIPSNALISRKQVARIYLALREGTSHQRAETLLAELRRQTFNLCVIHLASGE